MRYRYLLYLLLLIPIFAFRDYTPSNELKYISIIEEAFRNNTWFTFYNQGEIYADKPPLYFWLLMLSRLLTGGYHIWIMGLFSLIPAVGTLAVMDRWMRSGGVNHNAAASNLMLLTTGMFLGSALVLRMDMMMTFFITLSLYTFYRIYKGIDRKIEKYLLPVYIFLAVFSKGAMGFLVPYVTIAAFLFVKKDIRRFPKIFGWRQWLILAVLCGGWFSLIYAEGGEEYLNNILFKQTVGRGINSFHHKEQFWYYLLRAPLTFAPWSLLYIVLLWKGFRKRVFVTDTEKLFFTAVWVNFLMLSLISSKIDIYMLPVYPFVVYLSSALIWRFSRSAAVKTALYIPYGIFALALPAAVVAGKLLPYEIGNIWIGYIATAILSVSAVMAIYALYKNKVTMSILRGSSGLVLTLFVASFIIPDINPYLGLGEISREARNYANEQGIGNYNYYKFYTAPNMDVYLGQDLELVDSIRELDSLDNAAPRRVLFLRDKDIRRDADLERWVGSHHEMGRTGKHSWYVIGGKESTSDETVVIQQEEL